MSSENTVPRLHLREDEVIRLVLEFVSNRKLHISQVLLVKSLLKYLHLTFVSCLTGSAKSGTGNRCDKRNILR